MVCCTDQYLCDPIRPNIPRIDWAWIEAGVSRSGSQERPKAEVLDLLPQFLSCSGFVQFYTGMQSRADGPLFSSYLLSVSVVLYRAVRIAGGF